MKAFEVLESGKLPDGTPYRIVRRIKDGWTRCFILVNGKRKRRSMSWFRKQVK
jgi:hypothetical protein